MTARVGAVHLGWDVVSVAAGGGSAAIRPIQVEGTYTPPAYLLADASGRLHTAGVDRRPDVGIAISDVRDILGHPQIVVAGATWPADLVFRARLHNPLAEIVKHLGGPADVIAVPFPDEWPDAKVEEFMRLVEQLGVVAEPLPESVAMSGYVRALGLVRAPGRGPAVGATGVYSDGRECLVVAVDGDDEQPTESVSVRITPEALHQARAADNVVIEVMAAARAVGADTSTVLLAGNVCFNDAIRLAFQNHLGHRFQVADHPMHALVLGATHLLVNDTELAEGLAESGAGLGDSGTAADRAPVAPPAQPPVTPAGQPPVAPAPQPSGSAAPAAQASAAAQAPAAQDAPGRPAAPAQGTHGPAGEGGPGQAARSGGQPRHGRPAPAGPPSGPIGRQPAAAGPVEQGPAQGDASGVEETHRITPEELAQTPIASRGGLPPGLAGVGGRFTRPPGTPADDQMTSVMGRDPQQPGTPGAFGPAQQGGQPGGQGYPGYGAQGQQPGYAGGTPGYSGPQQGAPGSGAYGGQGGYGQSGGGYPQQGGYGQGGAGYGPQGGQSGAEQGGYHPDAGGRGSFAGSSGNAPGQAGSMYGGSMPSSGSRQNPQSSEDVAGQSDSESGAAGDRAPRKGKLWKKMKGNLFGTPIIVGAAALTVLGGYSDSAPPQLVASWDAPLAPGHAWDLTRLMNDACALTPFAVPPTPGVTGVEVPERPQCLTQGVDTLRYTIPGPVRGKDPGPPLHI
ncbi:hypothetical protein ACWIGI_11840 [Nocardia sp. NPDC055321]